MKRRLGAVLITFGLTAAAWSFNMMPSRAEGSSVNCSQIDPTLTGVLVFTPSGNFNGNCTTHTNPEGPGGPSGGGGAIVVPCDQLPQFGPGFEGNLIVSPSGNVNGNCRLHLH
jgi:hypothetical protein